MSEKRRLGDWTELDEDFLALAKYEYGRDRVSRALGYARRALRIGEISDRPHTALDALDFLITINLRGRAWARAQDHRAKVLLIGSHFDEPQLRAKATATAARVALAFKENRPGRNVAVPCWCEKVSTDTARGSEGYSPPPYGACCARADRDPYEMNLGYCTTPAIFDRALRGHPDPEVTLADYVRSWGPGKGPFVFFAAKYFDGWIEMHEMPHMARYHMTAARDASERVVADGKDVGSAMTAIILAVCSIEAFMFGVGLITGNEEPEHDPPTAGKKRREKPSLKDRWKDLGGKLCSDGWNPPGLESSLDRLISLRNGLVHPKKRWKEAPPTEPEPGKLVSEMSRPDWKAKMNPCRLQRELTADVTAWAVGVADSVVRHFGSHILDASPSGAAGQAAPGS